MTVDTPEDAAVAMAALPEYEPLPEFRPSLLSDAAVGRTFFLDGRLAKALPILASAAANCNALENPVFAVEASLWLGEALEAQAGQTGQTQTGQTGQAGEAGDVGAACNAYAQVVKRWGALGARSVSATLAKKRMQTLRCGKAPYAPDPNGTRSPDGK